MWHFLVTMLLGSATLWFYNHYTELDVTRKSILINMAIVPVCWTHSILIAIFAMRRFSRKEKTAGVIYLGHFALAAGLGYACYATLAIGLALSIL